eukprot:365408-Chlamydomonas_euryale.AAC.2
MQKLMQKKHGVMNPIHVAPDAGVQYLFTLGSVTLLDVYKVLLFMNKGAGAPPCISNAAKYPI